MYKLLFISAKAKILSPNNGVRSKIIADTSAHRHINVDGFRCEQCVCVFVWSNNILGLNLLRARRAWVSAWKICTKIFNATVSGGGDLKAILDFLLSSAAVKWLKVDVCLVRFGLVQKRNCATVEMAACKSVGAVYSYLDRYNDDSGTMYICTCECVSERDYLFKKKTDFGWQTDFIHMNLCI